MLQAISLLNMTWYVMYIYIYIYMHHQTAMFSEANLLRFDITIENIALDM